MEEDIISDFVLSIILIIVNFVYFFGIIIFFWKYSRHHANFYARRQYGEVELNVVVPEARLNIERFEEESMNGEENDDDCAICLAAFEKGGRSTVLCACNHKFHSDCISFWLAIRWSCPLCRTVVKVVS
nr:hypothetical protein BHE74_00054087 [Ipomoea trifida]